MLFLFLLHNDVCALAISIVGVVVVIIIKWLLTQRSALPYICVISINTIII